MDWLRVVRNPDYIAHIAACRKNYADKLPFLVLADRIEEWGHPSYAAFIRKRCEKDIAHTVLHGESGVEERAEHLFHTRQYITRIIPELEGTVEYERGFLRRIHFSDPDQVDILRWESSVYSIAATGQWLPLWRLIRETQPAVQIWIDGLRYSVTENALDDTFKIRNV